MNKETQLEQVAEKALRNVKLNLAPPIFELYSALVAISVACLFFLLPEILNENSYFDAYMLSVMPQGGWALAFFGGGVLSAVGILTDSRKVRIGALCILSVLYATVTVFYAFAFPNFGVVLIGWLTLFTIASIPLVKYTSIKHYR